MIEQNNNMYRSSDDKFFAGVCAGLAHKLGLSKIGLRVAFALGTLFFWLPLIVYIICWMIFPERPTHNNKKILKG
jgi:phage shock protein PspC (stress-responsive transcriptional regulator)